MALLDFFRRPAERTRATPFSEQGVGGSAVYGGQVQSGERAPSLLGSNRWKTAHDIMVNMSIVAAGLRYSLNLTARPSWRVEAADDSDAAKQAAEFVDSILHSTDTSWSRIIRRSAMYRYHGFGIHEWVAKRRDDGKIGIRTISPRPPATIVGWDTDEHGDVLGVTQRAPQTGREIYLPRQKLIYFVDDALTDSPEGMGWFRHLVEPRDRLKKFLQLEKIGFERDLAGTPVGKAPYAAIKAAVGAGTITEEQGEELVRGLEDFVRNKSKQPDTGLMLDSQPFVGKGSNGEQTVSGAQQWGIELLTSDAGSIEELGAAIQRTTWDMALIMGVERLLVGREGAGSLALSEDTSQNLFLGINSTNGDMAEALDRDLIGPVWAMNGLPDETRPTLKVEDASFKDATKIARTLADMANAGAILAPDDPAIDDVRDLAGISRQPEMTPERLGMLNPAASPITDPDDPDAPKPEPEA